MKLLAIAFHCIILCTGELELQKLHDVVVYSDWSSDDPELQRLMATWATTLAAMDSTGPCAEHRFLHTLRSTLHGVAKSLDHLVPDAALFLATECCRCEALRSAAMVLLKGDSETTFPIQRTAQRYYQTWAQSGHYDAAAPGAVELFRLLSMDQKPRECQVTELLSDVVIRWKNQLPASIERAQLGIVEFDDTGTSSCLDETMQLLEGTLEESDLNPTGYMVRPGLGTESVSSLQPGSSRIHYVSTVKLPEELEIVLLILSPRDQLTHLRMMARHLSLGRAFGIFIPLSNPHFAAVDDPLAIYEYLVWHGFRLQLPGGDQIRRSLESGK